MGTVNTIIKLLNSSNTEDYKIGKILLEKENYYPYMLEYMAEVLSDISLRNPISYTKFGPGEVLFYLFKARYKTIVKYERWAKI